MTDLDAGRFAVRPLTRSDAERQGFFARNMLIASACASLAIVGAGAFFISLWL